MSDVLRTAGAPNTLRLTPDKTVITADGKSLAFVTVEVVDTQGVLVPGAANLIHGLPADLGARGAGGPLRIHAALSLEARGAVVTGVDLSDEAIDFARALSAGSGASPAHSSAPTSTTASAPTTQRQRYFCRR